MSSVLFIFKSQEFGGWVRHDLIEEKMKRVNLTRSKPGAWVQCLEVKANH